MNTKFRTEIVAVKPLWVLISLLVVLSACNHDEPKSPASVQSRALDVITVPQERDSMLPRKPYISLKLESEYVPFEVFVNGAFVTTDLSGTASSETWPINQYLRSGSNQFALLLYTWQLKPGEPATIDPRAKVLVRVLVRDFDQPEGHEYELATVAFDGAEHGKPDATAKSSAPGELDSRQGFERARSHGDVTIGPVGVQEVDIDGKVLITRDISMSLPFPEWAFLRSETSAPTYAFKTEAEIEPHYRELMAAYERVWSLLQARQYTDLIPLFEERSREIDQSTYQPLGSTMERLRASFQTALNDASLELAPIQPTKGTWKYDAGPSGKLRRLSRGAHSAAIIRFVQKNDRRFATGFPIAFRKESGKFIVSR